jgi:hypothetical protein
LKLRKGKVFKKPVYLIMLLKNKPRYFFQFILLGTHRKIVNPNKPLNQ